MATRRRAERQIVNENHADSQTGRTDEAWDGRKGRRIANSVKTFLHHRVAAKHFMENDAVFRNCSVVLHFNAEGDVSGIAVANGASRRVAERNGYRLEGVLRSLHIKQGVREDTETSAPGRIGRRADWTAELNPRSLEVLTGCRLEPGLANAAPGSRWQFERQGYFCVDTRDSHGGAPVFNRTTTLADTWAKIEKAQQRK